LVVKENKEENNKNNLSFFTSFLKSNITISGKQLHIQNTVEFPVKHVFVVMGKAAAYAHWYKTIPSNVRLVFGAYDTNETCQMPSMSDKLKECLFILGTTWSVGRNLLVQHVQKTLTPAVTFITLADADIQLRCGDSDCIESWIIFLEQTNAPAAFLIGDGFFKSAPNTMFQSDSFDAAFNAFHIDAINTVLPYETKFDDISWWICQAVLWQRIHCFAPVYALAPLNIFYENPSHDPYPRGRDRDKEIQSQRDFVTAQNLSMPLPSVEYTDNWNMEHVIPISYMNWTNICRANTYISVDK